MGVGRRASGAGGARELSGGSGGEGVNDDGWPVSGLWLAEWEV